MVTQRIPRTLRRRQRATAYKLCISMGISVEYEHDMRAAARALVEVGVLAEDMYGQFFILNRYPKPSNEAPVFDTGFLND